MTISGNPYYVATVDPFMFTSQAENAIWFDSHAEAILIITLCWQRSQHLMNLQAVSEHDFPIMTVMRS